MAEVVVRPGDDLNSKKSPSMARLRRISQGVLKEAKACDRIGPLTKNQKKRLKKSQSRSRFLQERRRQMAEGYDPLDEKDYVKLLAQSHPLYHDGDFAVEGRPDQWNFDLTPLDLDFKKEVEKWKEREAETRWQENQARRHPERESFRFGESRRRKPAFLDSPFPSIHACVIPIWEIKGEVRIPVVRALNDNGTERTHFQFPGGGVKLMDSETPESCGNRECEEEIGLKVEVLTVAHRIDEQIQGLHTFIGFLANVTGGRLRPGREIVELRTLTLPELRQMADSEELSLKHLKLFRKLEAALAGISVQPQPKKTLAAKKRSNRSLKGAA